jgi:hypothetical protein
MHLLLAPLEQGLKVNSGCEVLQDIIVCAT